MRVAICLPGRGIVEHALEYDTLAHAALDYPDHDCIPMADIHHPAEPGAAYERRAAVCRVTRADGRMDDRPRAQCRIGR